MINDTTLTMDTTVTLDIKVNTGNVPYLLTLFYFDFPDEVVKEVLQRANNVYSAIHAANGLEAKAVGDALITDFMWLCKNAIALTVPAPPAFDRGVTLPEFLAGLHVLSTLIEACQMYPNATFNITVRRDNVEQN